MKERAWSEGEQFKKLSHPNIVPVYDVFRANNTVYIVMKCLEGKTLTSYLRDGAGGFRALPPTEALTLIEKLEAPLTYLHRANILHRDIKPDNIMRLPDGTPVLIDLGGAREFFKHSQSYTKICSKGFSSPEQYDDRFQATPAVDVYSLAATLYFLLTGTGPRISISRLGDSDDMPSPWHIDPRIPLGVSHAVMRGMEPRMADRIPTVKDFISALKGQVVRTTSTPVAPAPQASPLPAAYAPEPRTSGGGLAWLWGIGGVMAIVGLFLIGFHFIRPVEPVAAKTQPPVNRDPGGSALRRTGRAGYAYVGQDAATPKPGKRPAPKTVAPSSLSQEIDRELVAAIREGRDTKWCRCADCKCQLCECTPSNTRDSED